MSIAFLFLLQIYISVGVLSLVQDSPSALFEPGKKYEVVKSSISGEYLLIQKTVGTIHIIQDIAATLAEFYIGDTASIPIIDDTNLLAYTNSTTSPFISLKKDINNPDDLIGTIVKKSILLQPPIYWKESYFLTGYFNPAFVAWNNETLVAWRSASVRGVQNSYMQFGWIKDRFSNDFRTVPELKHFGIGLDFVSELKDSHDFAFKDDPRLLLLHDNSLLLTYATMTRENPHQQFNTVLLTLNSSTGKAQFGENIELTHPESGLRQKNWIPLEYRRKVYYIQHINPLVVVRPDDNDTTPAVREAKTVYRQNKVKLPFPEEYGDLRGGTPAILIHHRYLSFFHTRSNCQRPFRMATYLMGAITFCPHPPFAIHAVTYQPIVNQSFYEGPWIWPSLDFGVYPSGIIYDKDRDRNHVWVSIGHQDKNAYVVKFDVNSLYRSMEVVGNCSQHNNKQQQQQQT